MKDAEEYFGQELEAYEKGVRDYEKFLGARRSGDPPEDADLISPAPVGLEDEDDGEEFTRSCCYEPPYEYMEAYEDGWRSAREDL